MSKMRILLTGGGGMVGSNLLEHPAIGEFEIVAPRSSELDLRDYASVLKYLIQFRPDMVVHAAGRVGGIHANMREPVGFLLDNLDMGCNLVRAAHQVGIGRLLNLGSSCMYPRNSIEPLHEEMVLKGELEPTNEGYALAKVVTARLCEYLVRENPDLLYKTLIPCNLYGRYDNFDPAHSHLVPAIIHKIHLAKRNGLNSVEIWGDGTARREFMYAGDLADCLIEAIRRFDTLPCTMNVGIGEDVAINEYYSIAAEVIGYSGKFHHDLLKPVGMLRKLVSVEKSMAWGWHPKTDLREGLRKTYDFYLQSMN